MHHPCLLDTQNPNPLLNNTTQQAPPRQAPGLCGHSALTTTRTRHGKPVRNTANRLQASTKQQACLVVHWTTCGVAFAAGAIEGTAGQRGKAAAPPSCACPGVVATRVESRAGPPKAPIQIKKRFPTHSPSHASLCHTFHPTLQDSKKAAWSSSRSSSSRRSSTTTNTTTANSSSSSSSRRSRSSSRTASSSRSENVQVSSSTSSFPLVPPS